MKFEATSLVGALRQHPVFRVATVYGIAGWLLIQFGDISLEAFGAPPWAMRALLMTVLVGFPLTVTLTWLLRRSKGPGRTSTLIAVSCIVAAIVLSMTVYRSMSEEAAEATDAASAPVRGSNPVLAVLPLDNMSSDKSIDYVADGLTEDIITLLAQSPGLQVIARNSTFKFKDLSPDIRAVGRDLGADYVVEGSLRPMGDRFRVTVQVIETAGGAHVWADSYDRPADAFLSVQDDISLGVAAAVGDVIFRKEFNRLKQSRTGNVTAWGLTSRADMSFAAQSADQLDEGSFELHRAAVAADPDYGLAHAVLARALAIYGLFGLGIEHSAAVRDEAEREARQALKLSPDDPKVLAYAATALSWVGRPAEALPLAEKAVRLSPSYAQGLLYYGDILIHNGRAQEGLPHLRKAIELTPDAPELAVYLICLGEAYIHLADYATAETAFREADRLAEGANATVTHYLAGTQLQLGKVAEARASLERVRAQHPGRSVAEERAVLAFYSTDGGGEQFKVLWQDLEALERSLPPAA